MSPINSILATIEFEISRVMTVRRMAVALVMALFPPVMILILASGQVFDFPEMTLSVLCGMICLLSLLLWATPNVYSELEGKSWTFVTTRPHGRLSILFGKYLMAAGMSFLVPWVGLSLAMLVIDPELYLSNAPRLELWFYLSCLLALASTVYAAIFSFFGVIVQRRAMVVAVGYFIGFEILLALAPAVIGKLAMTYHLFCLQVQWVGWITGDVDIGREEFANVWGIFPVWMHLLAIATVTAVMLTLSAIVIQWREYITLEDAQV